MAGTTITEIGVGDRYAYMLAASTSDEPSSPVGYIAHVG